MLSASQPNATQVESSRIDTDNISKLLDQQKNHRQEIKEKDEEIQRLSHQIESLHRQSNSTAQLNSVQNTTVQQLREEVELYKK